MKTKNRFRIYLWSRGEHSRLFRVGISKRPSRRKSFIPVINLNSFQAPGHFLIIQMNGLSSPPDNGSQNKLRLGQTDPGLICLAQSSRPLSWVLSPVSHFKPTVMELRKLQPIAIVEQRNPLSSSSLLKELDFWQLKIGIKIINSAAKTIIRCLYTFSCLASAKIDWLNVSR